MISFSDKKRILIFGFAREGVSTLKFLRNHGVTGKIYIFDDQKTEKLDQSAKSAIKIDKDIHFISKKDLDDAKGTTFDLVFLTPGIPKARVPKRLWQVLTSQTALFLETFARQTIGVTGTKGKGTTSSLIYEILQKAGFDVVLLGNIGTPALDYFDKVGPKTLIVFELSSHQLTLTNNSPHIAVFLNIFPEHLDYYGSFESYKQAKARIAIFQSNLDHLIINKESPKLQDVVSQSRAAVHPIVVPSPAWKTKLLGSFNQGNIAAAWEVAKLFKVNEKTARLAVANFQPLEHRLEFVGTFKNLTFFNDSFATVPESTILAMNTIGARLETIITGGFDRGIKYTQLSQEISASGIKTLILFPTTGEKILKGITREMKVFRANSMKEAVSLAFQNTTSGKTVLLSCASPSFNLFKDFKDRGTKFKDWVVKLGNSS